MRIQEESNAAIITDHQKLPASLKRRRNQRIIIRIVSCILLLAFVLVVMFLWGRQIFPIPDDTIGDIFRIILYVLLSLLPFVITGVPKKLIDRSFSGTVTAVEIKETTGTYTVGGRPWPYTKEDMILTIKKDDGKSIKFNVLSLGVKENHWRFVSVLGKIEHHTTEYNVGDRVHKYYGYKHLYVEPAKTQDSKQCIVCGVKNPLQSTVCWDCHSELL